jgi:hypothetical protein
LATIFILNKDKWESGMSNLYQQSEQGLRRMRQRIFDYDGTPKEAQADRVLYYLKKRKMRGIEAAGQQAPVGYYSGLTQTELRKSGTCETDWY